MRIKFIFILFIITFLSCKENGNSYYIEGNWNFYKNVFLKSDSVDPNSQSYTSLNISNNHDDESKISSNFGTISKTINVEPNLEYSLYISNINSASKIWIDDINVSSSGKIGKTKQDSEPRVEKNIVNFLPKSEHVTIYIEFSDFYLNENFIFRWMLIGNTDEIVNLYLKQRSIYFGTIGFTLMTFIIFLMIYFVNKNDKYYLYFSLFSLTYCIRSLFMEHGIILYFFSNFPWILEYQLTKMSEILSLAIIIQFFKSMYSTLFHKKLTRIITVITISLSPVVFIPIDLFTKYQLLNYIHYWILFGGLFILINLFIGITRREKNSLLAFLSILFFYGSIVVDILASSKFTYLSYISGQAFFVVIVSIFLMVGRKMLETTTFLVESQVADFQLKELFSRFVPVEILARLNNKELLDREPGDYCIEPLTMVYIDIRDFTKLSEGLSAKENFKLINDFYEIVSSNIKKYNGFIESYGGDGVKAFFDSEPNNAISACNEIRKDVCILNNIRIGISLNFGRVVLGTIGCSQRQQATGVSEETRLLSKMDRFISRMGIEMVITDKVYTLSSLKDEDIMCLGEIYLNDEYDPVTLYQVLSKNDNIDLYFVEAFELGVKLLKQKKFVKAYSHFILAKKYNPGHKLTKFYIEELEKHITLRGLSFKLKC